MRLGFKTERHFVIGLQHPDAMAVCAILHETGIIQKGHRYTRRKQAFPLSSSIAIKFPVLTRTFCLYLAHSPSKHCLSMHLPKKLLYRCNCICLYHFLQQHIPYTHHPLYDCMKTLLLRSCLNVSSHT